MQYIGGVITQTADDTCVVAVTIDGTHKLFSISKKIFYTFGMKCDGSLANILEVGMEVDLCYRLTHPGNKPHIMAVWFGDKPDVIEDSTSANLYEDSTSANLYDQGGRVTYFVDDENFLVQNDDSNYTVIVSTEATYRDGLRLEDAGTTVTMGEEMQYDAVPFDAEDSSGASYKAVCAWVGGKVPRVVDRFHLRSWEKCTVDSEMAKDVNGIVVTIPNDMVAVVEGQFKSHVVKVLLFRSSFGVDCDSIRDLVDVKDNVCMRIGFRCMFSGKMCYAVNALKLSGYVGSVPRNDLPLITGVHNCVTEDTSRTEMGLVQNDDVHVPAITQNCVKKEKRRTKINSVQKDNPVPATIHNFVKKEKNWTNASLVLKDDVPERVGTLHSVAEGKPNTGLQIARKYVPAPVDIQNSVAGEKSGTEVRLFLKDGIPGPVDFQNSVTEGKSTRVGLVLKDDISDPVDTRNSVADGKHITEIGFVRNDDVPQPVDTHNSVSEGRDQAGNDVKVINGIDCVKEVHVGVTKHFNCVRNKNVSGNSLLFDEDGRAVETANNVSKVAVRNYVDVGMKSAESSDVEVADIISFAGILQDRTNTKPAGKPLANVGWIARNAVLKRSVSKVTNSQSVVADATSSNPSVSYSMHSFARAETGNVTESNVADATPSKPSVSYSMHSFASAETGNVTDSNVDAMEAKQSVDELTVVDDAERRENDCKDDVTDELSDVVSSNSRPVIYDNISSDPSLLYSVPPLSGIISRFALDCGCIAFKHFKVFVKPNNFYTNGAHCPVKCFVKLAKRGNRVVNFEAVTRSADAVNPEFTHEATCAWVGNKPLLASVLADMPRPIFSVVDPPDQDFRGVVSRLLLPDYAFVVFPEDETTVVVHVNSFKANPQYSDNSVGLLITDYVKFSDTVIFKVKRSDCEIGYLIAWDVRTTKDLTSKIPAPEM